MEETLNALVSQLLGPLGLTIGLIVTVIAFALEYVVPGKRHREDLQTWKTIAERALQNAEANTDLLEDMVETLDENTARPVRRRRATRGPA